MSSITLEHIREAKRKLDELGPIPPPYYWKATPHVEQGCMYKVRIELPLWYKGELQDHAYLILLHPDDLPNFLDVLRREGVEIPELRSTSDRHMRTRCYDGDC